mmetsp:Transcript_15008/g.14878  ORF Transcript_15008/g.14878 Transcript_15008/m.14878 type:complete len:141 (+) Transcript_15008:1246-1668(+)
MFKKTLESRRIFMFVDVHGHSRKSNCFMYGCSNKTSDKKNYEKIFPMRFGDLHSTFSYEDCSFNVSKDKESTGRVVVRREYNILNSFTLESSFLGANKGIYQDTHFTPEQLKDIGRSFCKTLNDAEDPKIKATILKKLSS